LVSIQIKLLPLLESFTQFCPLPLSLLWSRRRSATALLQPTSSSRSSSSRRCPGTFVSAHLQRLLLTRLRLLLFLLLLWALQAERARTFAAEQQQQQQPSQPLLPPGLLSVRIYSASYSGPLERSSFQGAVARESSVFADLIRAKQHLVLPLDMGHNSLQQVCLLLGASLMLVV
jgi:hypothetical protein